MGTVREDLMILRDGGEIFDCLCLHINIAPLSNESKGKEDDRYAEMKETNEFKLSKSREDLKGKASDLDLSEGEDSTDNDDKDEINGRPKSRGMR
jgi:hypothetical protein